MKNLIVKNVDFMGDGLLAGKDMNGIIWASVSYFCNALGMTKNAKDRQVKKIQSDETLKRGCVKFDAGVFDPNNETLALQLDYVPLWLAKISITPTMKMNSPEVVEKLVNYQLKAKDILAAAFLPQKYNPPTFPEQATVPAPLRPDWYSKNKTRLRHICDKLDISHRELYHELLNALGKTYDINAAREIYKRDRGYYPEYAIDIVGYFPELAKATDKILDMLA